MKMVTKFVLLNVNLTAFDGEEPSATENTSNIQTVGSEGQPTVVYGVQEDVQPVTNEPESTPKLTPEQKFDEMIKGEFKDVYASKFQSAFDKRFKDYKQIESKLGENQPIIELLMEKHKVKTPQELYAKIENESIEDLAYENEMTVEQYKKVRELERENKIKTEKLNEYETEKEKNIRISKWFEEEADVKKVYPEFDLKEWVQVPKFNELLRSGVSVQAAYEVSNLDAIKTSVAQQTQSATIDTIRSKGMRPSENANNKSSQGVIFKNDPSKLTKEDRAKIAQMVQRGETIRF